MLHYFIWIFFWYTKSNALVMLRTYISGHVYVWHLTDMTFGESGSACKHHMRQFVEAYHDYIKIGTALLCQPWLYCTALCRLLPRGARQRRNRRVMWQFVQTVSITCRQQCGAAQRVRVSRGCTVLHPIYFTAMISWLTVNCTVPVFKIPACCYSCPCSRRMLWGILF